MFSPIILLLQYTPTTYGVIPPASAIAPVSAPIAPASTTGPVVATPVQNPKLLEASKKVTLSKVYT